MVTLLLYGNTTLQVWVVSAGLVTTVQLGVSHLYPVLLAPSLTLRD